MSWDLTISARVDDDETPLGTLEAVKATLRAALPTIEFSEEASGAEMLAAGIRFPPAVHEYLAARPASHAGEVSTANLHLRFDLGPGGDVAAISVEVRGSDDPLPALHRLAEVSGWAIVDSSTGQELPFDTTPEGLARYRNMVARIIERPPNIE